MDFYCHECKLVVEVDGSIHIFAEQKEYYIGRTYELDNDYADAIIQLTDITGKTVKQYKTGMTMDYLIVQTGNLKKGNYFVKLILNNREAGMQKVVIQ